MLRYPKQLFTQEWNIKQRRGKPGVEWWMIYLLHEVEGGDSSAASFMATVDECIILVRGNISCMMRDLI